MTSDTSSPLVWFLLLDSTTGLPYKRTTVSSVLRSSLVVPVIDQFRQAVKVENSAIFTGITSSQLLVYKNKAAFDTRNFQDGNKEEPLKSSCSLNDLGLTEDNALIVVVPSRDRDTPNDFVQQIKRPKIIWGKSTPLVRLTYEGGDLFRLDKEYLANTGLSCKELVLYCRPSFHDQFKFLQKRVIDEGVYGWILGPPGTGKSTTALSFASTLNTNEWIVTWIHLSRITLPLCVRLEDGLKKSCDFIGKDTDKLDDMLMDVDESKKHIVFIDGFVSNDVNDCIQQVCLLWRDIDRVRRRLVIVCSMNSLYKVKDDEVFEWKIEVFNMYSWTKEEYLAAVQQADFFNHIQDALDSHVPPDKVFVDAPLNLFPQASPEEKVLSKMYFAGSSARWMFSYKTEFVLDRIHHALDQVTDIVPYIKGTIGDRSNYVINRLLGSNLTSSGRKTSIVSRYAALQLAIATGPDMIRRLAEVTRHDGNPSMDDWMLEMWFFASLCKGGIKLFKKDCTDYETWPEVSNIVSLDVTNFESFPTLPETDGIWFKPIRWNYGGYDAIYINKGEKGSDSFK